MNFKPLPFHSSLELYREQADELLAGCRAGDAGSIECFKQRHPRFLDAKIRWLPKNVLDSEVQGAGLGPADAELTVARWYDFQDWRALANYVEAITRSHSTVFQFESAVEAIVAGDLQTLESLLRAQPELVRTRSIRVTHFDPPVHGATLLHYVAANGVEGYRQKTPKNAVDVARLLLTAGAEVDALADMYGGRWSTLSLLVSSCHPAAAGVQASLVDVLADYGATLDGGLAGKWMSPLLTALAFGYRSAAEALVRRGAKVENIAAAAGLGRLEDVRRLLADSDKEGRHRAFVLAAQLGHVEVVRFLLDAGEDPNRYNPAGNHAHSTPLHQAALAGNDAVVRLLVERGAKVDMKDTIYQATPLGWATHGGHPEIEKFLRRQNTNTTVDNRDVE